MDSAHPLAELAASALESATLMIDVAAGYKQHAIEAGFSEHMAEHMALDYHRCLLQQSVGPTA